MTSAPPAAGQARYHLTDRFGGISAPPYDELNLAVHVGDDPSAVTENRRRLAARLDVESTRMRFLHQVHGADVVVADDVDEPVEADALVTTQAQLPLVVLVADCVPVVLMSQQPPVVAVAHAGRRGLVAGVVPATLRVMARLGATPATTTAFLGPSICGACYEVPADLRAAVAAVAPASHAATRMKTPALDVSRGVRAQLQDAGVPAIDVDPRCTRDSPELYSHRRDGRSGRFAAVAWIEQ